MSRELVHLLGSKYVSHLYYAEQLRTCGIVLITYRTLSTGAANFEAGNSIDLPWIMEGSWLVLKDFGDDSPTNQDQWSTQYLDQIITKRSEHFSVVIWPPDTAATSSQINVRLQCRADNLASTPHSIMLFQAIPSSLFCKTSYSIGSHDIQLQHSFYSLSFADIILVS